MRRRLTRRDKKKRTAIISTLCLLLIMTVGYAAFQTKLNMTAKGNILEKSRVMQSWIETSNEDFHSDYYKANIVSATFLDSAVVPSNAAESWDVSEAKDEGVIAYVIPNSEDNTKYDLYIGAKDGVVANENSDWIFGNFTSITNINFNNNFNTENATSMHAMFWNCQSLRSLDLSSFNTSKVVTLQEICGACYSLTDINLNGWNTSNVSNMRGLFYQNYSLTTIDLSGFDTSKVTNMRAMFMDANKLTEINLCNFDTRNVEDTMDMFANTTSLTKIKVGPNWSMEKVQEDYNMFGNSGVSEVTTGEC